MRDTFSLSDLIHAPFKSKCNKREKPMRRPCWPSLSMTRRFAVLLCVLTAISCVSAAADRDKSSRHLQLDPSTVNPKSRFLTLGEWLQYLATEAGEEFEVDPEFAESLGLTLEELAERSEDTWRAASRFEFARAIRDGWEYGLPYPFIICNTDEAQDGERLGGYERRQRLGGAIFAAAASVGIELKEIVDDVGYIAVYNGPDAWCGLGLINGLIAEAIEGGIVQPLFMSMKMAADTVDTITQWMEDFYSEGDIEDMIEEDQNKRNLEDDAKRARREKFPSATFTICPGGVSEEDYDTLDPDNLESNDFTAGMTEWLVNKTDAGDEITQQAILENVFWTNQAQKLKLEDDNEENGYVTEQGKLWNDVLTLSFQGSACVDTFKTRLIWTPLFGKSFSDVHALKVEFNHTGIEKIESYCVLGMLAGLSLHHSICQLEIDPVHTVSNDHAQWLTQTGVVDERPFFDVGLNGTGQVVAVSDTGVDIRSCYFADSNVDEVAAIYLNNHRKVVQYDDFVDNFDYTNGHGTHVAGTVCGNREDGAGIGQGIAPGAKLAFIDLGNEQGALTLPPNERILGIGRLNTRGGPKAAIHSASWGVAGNNKYNFQARDIDNHAYQNDEFLFIAAAGNQGRYDQMSTVTTPSTAKNCISVGASHSYGNDLGSSQLGPAHVADFSSRGPSADGRTKPDLVAPGKWIVSAAAALPDTASTCGNTRPKPGESIDGLVSMGGTSMATPITAATAAIVRQYLSEGWYGDGTKNSARAVKKPSASLIKAILMNGCQMDVIGVDNGAANGGVTPVKPYDEAAGFGRLSLTHSVYIKGKTDVQLKFWDRAIVKSVAKEFSVPIDKSNGCQSDRLSVTLVWAEKPALANCLKCLLNDLDLTVTKVGEESKMYFPNGLNTSDRKNNVERVVIDGVSTGDSFTISVDPYNLDTRYQKFALVATGCFGGVANDIDTRRSVYSTGASIEEDNSIIDNATPQRPTGGSDSTQAGATSDQSTQISMVGKTEASDFLKCQHWCDAISNSWEEKCEWTFSCSLCEQCIV